MTKARRRGRQGEAPPLTFSASGMFSRIVCMQPMLKQILEWGSWTAVKASRAPFQSFLSAASTPSFQRLMASARDMVRRKPGGWEAARTQGEGEQVSSLVGCAPACAFQTWCSEWGPASLKTTSQCCKGSGNVPTFWQLTHSPTVREKRKETERAGGCGAECGGEEVHQILLGMGHFPKMLLLCHPAVLCLPPPLGRAGSGLCPQAQGKLGRWMRPLGLHFHTLIE